MLTGEILRIVRLSNGLSLTALSQQAGVSKSLLSFIERGDRRLTPEIEQRLRRALRLNDQRLHQCQESLQVLKTV